ncbi:MAG: metallophosphoesterase, partial [Methylococcales bacterium]|nr:metallophosphoesterase [Methylococcales bacterium]
MKILAVSDKVLPHLYAEDVTQRYPDVDMLIGCGDLPYYYLDFLVSAFNKPLLFVNGNHDGGSQYLADGSTIDRVQGGDDVDLRVVTRKGLTIAGLEGSIRYRPGLPHTYTEGEMKRRAARLMLSLLHHRLRTGRRLDILVTHSPPFGIHDAKDFPHVGF